MFLVAGRSRVFAAAGFVVAIWAGSTHAQQAPPLTPSQQSALNQAELGLESPEEARKIVGAIVKGADELKPVLGSMNPQLWYEKRGAPSTYVIQWQTAQRQLNDVDLTARSFSLKLEDLPAALDLYFRLEALETTARSVNEGAQRYGDAASASRLASFVAHDFDTRQRLRDYIRELANNVQQNFTIADAEAQRCRAALSKQAPPATATRKTRHD